MSQIVSTQKPLFPLGKVVATPGALKAIPAKEICRSLSRHQTGDWGNLSPADQRANNDAVSFGGRFLSAYRFQDTRYWIITEADRSATTVLLPSEY